MDPSGEFGLGLSFEQEEIVRERLGGEARRWDLVVNQTVNIELMQKMQEQIFALAADDVDGFRARARESMELLQKSVAALKEYMRSGVGGE